jgi:hypothetical protein
MSCIISAEVIDRVGDCAEGTFKEAHGLNQKARCIIFALNCPANMNEHKPVVKRIYSGTDRFSVMVTGTAHLL